MKINNKGFTLVEILAVVILLGVLATIAFPAILNVYQDVKVKTMRLAENNIKSAAKMYIEDCYSIETKENLNGCAYTDITADTGYVFLSDMIYDQYTEAVTFDDTECTGYVEYLNDDYSVCIRCGGAYQTEDAECTFDYTDNKLLTYEYTGSGYHTFMAMKTGKYRVELWGAHGGGATTGKDGGYTSGVIKLLQNEKLYIYVGGNTQGTNCTSYNGGQGTSGGYCGGGASDVRLVPGDWDNIDSLVSRIMVAAGGGTGTTSGAAGGIVGYSGSASTGGTQLGGGAGSNGFTNGSFGLGGTGCGGGGGYYGGGGALCNAGGAGGSSYISGHTGSVAIISASLRTPKTGCLSGSTSTTCSLHYSNKKFTSTVMIDGNGYKWTNVRGNKSGMPSHVYGRYFELGTGNPGNGFARITYLSN